MLKLDFTPQNLHESEWLMQKLSEFPDEACFGGFEETETGFSTYIVAESLPELLEDWIKNLQNDSEFAWEFAQIPDQNWNAEWESNYAPVEIEDFCRIRADFHPSKEGFKYELLITPKRSFGTGHHATTEMMVLAMRGLDFNNKSTLDYGTGTGVLAILAHKLGAQDIDANDIDTWVIENAQENAENNQSTGIRLYLGGLEVLPERTYERILANINRNILLESMPTLAQRLEKGGILLMSGFYPQPDAPILIEAAAAHGLRWLESYQKGEWAALKFVRN
jgi:ribosomal protein L11 methyltransferase